MICDSKCCRRSGEKVWCKKNLGLKGLLSATLRSPFLYVYIKKGVIRRIFAELTLNLLLKKPFLAENTILESKK